MSIRKKLNNIFAALIVFFLIIEFFDKEEKSEIVQDSIKKKVVIYHPPKRVEKEKEKYYDFLVPKEGKTLNISNKNVAKIYKRRSLEKKFPNGYSVTSYKEVYASTAASTSKRLYFVNAYLNGYVPYQANSVWQPLQLLRTRLKYQYDMVQYQGRSDVWQTSKQSFSKLRGDCEDHAIVLADWLIGLGYDARIVLGEVQFKGQKRGGHAWVVLFEENKEYILEATSKRKWNQLPLASSLPYYYPKYMFNRRYFWTNQGSIYTVKYSGKKWKKSGEFLPDEPYYPDLNKHALYVETQPEKSKVRILNIKEKFHQGIRLRTGRYYIEVSKKGYNTRKSWIDINDQELHIKSSLSPLV